MKPYIIKGEKKEDSRGSLSFINDFDLQHIRRFYIVENNEENPARGWIAHKKDTKHFYCLKGAFEIYYVKIDDWENPSENLEVEKYQLNETCLELLVVPEGYATVIKSLKKNSQLLNFSPLTLEETSDESIRYNLNMWDIEK